ncbi:MAG: endonuclease III domain-containing protein [Candidatus Nanoarchaeia archaeon]
MDNKNIDTVIRILKKKTKQYVLPIVTQYSFTKNPFFVLISTVLSLRTKDLVTAEASRRLFKLADTPSQMRKLSQARIEKAIYPVGFYKTKAKNVLRICAILNENEGKVPDEIENLLELPGVGRKTANLVVTLGYGKLGICVDTHVHRISNRLGYVNTKSPDKTEFALRKKLPKKYWIIYNDLLVTWGQNVCVPISPWCSKCAIRNYCPRKGVEKSR